MAQTVFVMMTIFIVSPIFVKAVLHVLGMNGLCCQSSDLKDCRTYRRTVQRSGNIAIVELFDAKTCLSLFLGSLHATASRSENL